MKLSSVKMRTLLLPAAILAAWTAPARAAITLYTTDFSSDQLGMVGVGEVGYQSAGFVMELPTNLGTIWSQQASSSAYTTTTSFAENGFTIAGNLALAYSTSNPSNTSINGFIYFYVTEATSITYTGSVTGGTVSGTGNGASLLDIKLFTFNETTQANTNISTKSSSTLSDTVTITATLQPGTIYGVSFSEKLSRSRSGTGSRSAETSFTLTTAAAVPEPATLALLIPAFAMLMARRKRFV